MFRTAIRFLLPVIVLTGIQSAFSQQIISTIAGTTFVFPSQPLPAVNAPTGSTSGVVLDSNGNLYVSDADNCLVVKVNSQGTLSVLAGNGTCDFSGDGGKATNAALFSPQGLALDPQGNLYIADQTNSRVRKVTPAGIITTVAGNGDFGYAGDGGLAINATLNSLTGVAVDSNGNIYIADQNNHRIRKVTPNGIISTIAGNGTSGFGGDSGQATAAMLSYPSGIALDGNGNLFIADSGNNRIRKVTSGGIITTVAGGGSAFPGSGGQATAAELESPVGVAFDVSGNLLIVNGGAFSNAGLIQKVTPAGIISLIAGNGLKGFSGDGGPALNAVVAEPSDIAADPTSGNLFLADTSNRRVRRITTTGIISTVVGNGAFRFGGDGGPATAAYLNAPISIAVDASQNIYFVDAENNRIRKIAPSGAITTVAGNGIETFGGDNGQAVNASLDIRFPAEGPFGIGSGIAVDNAGNIFVADTDNDRIRKITPTGIITTVAGGGAFGVLGDEGPATKATMIAPAGIAFGPAGNLFIADFGNNRIRRVGPDGFIHTVAGNGTSGFSGDTGPAISAEISEPNGVAVDSNGVLYIADFGNNRVRKVGPDGNIFTVAGTGAPDSNGDGGLATKAASLPVAVAVDNSGNLYVTELASSRIRVVNASGIINTIVNTAGAEVQGFSGDGGPAANAALNLPSGIAFDSSGNMFIADTGNNRIREVQAVSPTFNASPATLSFSAVSGGLAPPAQKIHITGSIASLPFTVQDGSSWLTLSAKSGTLPSDLLVTVDPSKLAAGPYTDNIIITVPTASPSTINVPVSFNVTAPAPQILSLSNQSLSFSVTQGGGASTLQLTLTNQGSGSLTFTASALGATGGNWISISPASGTVTAASPVSLTVTASPGTLQAGTYTGSISIASSSTGQVITTPATLAISAPPQKIILSQLGLTFTAVAQGGTVLPQSLSIVNGGSGTMNWSAKAITATGGSWLNVSASSGTVTRPFLDVSSINVSVNAQGLAPGNYYGQIQVSAPGASNSPQATLVVLNVLPPGSNPGPNVQPSGLVFTGVAGAPNPGSKNVLVGNVQGINVSFGSAVAYNPDAGTWLKFLPKDATVTPGQPTQMVLQPDFGQLTPGAYRGALTLIFDDGEIRTVGILAVIAPPGTTPITPAIVSEDGSRHAASVAEPRAAGCVPKKLYPIFTQLGSGANIPAGWPVAMAAEVVDDCGNAIDGGSVVASFNNGDNPVSLMDMQAGQWSGTWQPRAVGSSGVTVTLTASMPSANISGVAQQNVGMQGNQSQSLPVLATLPISAVTQTPGPLAPGDLVLIKGTGIANSQASSSSSSLPQTLGGASLLIGGRLAPLLYVDQGQMIALVPPDVPVNSTQQVLAQRDISIGVPAPVIISTTHPSILSKDGSGQGQAMVYNASGGATTLADGSNPGQPGGSIIIYCSGLGAVDGQGNAMNIPTVSVAGAPAKVSYAGLALRANYPPTGAPMLLGGVASAGLGGLYQITATIPAGVGGQVPVSISSAGQSSQSGVTMVLASSSTGNAPAIASIDTAGGFPTIAQNGWIEIKGTNLAPASVGAGLVWSSAPEFAMGRMPTQLSGVSATVNNNPAFIYFVSPGQINVLTPLDSTTGSVQVIVTVNGVPSAPFTATERAGAPSFLLLPGQHVVAVHQTATCSQPISGVCVVGPASLYPGYSVPAQPGETISLYAVGFGLPSTPLVNGSSTQSGSLPTLPVITIGGTQAMVTFAGVISPGLYQFNVTIPANAPNGDNTITCSYGGLSTPTGDLITVQR